MVAINFTNRIPTVGNSVPSRPLPACTVVSKQPMKLLVTNTRAYDNFYTWSDKMSDHT